MSRVIIAVVLSFSLSAFAASRTDHVTRALEHLESATESLDRVPSACRKKVQPKLDALDEALRAAKREPTDSNLGDAKKAATRAADRAEGGCGGSAGTRLVKSLTSAADALAEALEAKESSGISVPFGAIAQGFSGLLAGGAQHNATKKERSRTTTSEKVNGKEIDADEPQERPAKKAEAEKPAGAAFGATCRKNHECESNTCFVGKGSVGFCTKMCSEDDDCPRKMFEWECYRPAGLNAPQKLCLQSRD